MAKNWIAGAIGKKGSLHKALHVPMSQTIPAPKLAGAKDSINPKIRKEATLAQTLKGFTDHGSGHHTKKISAGIYDKK